MLLMTGLASRRPHEKPARRNGNEFRTFRAIPGQFESGRRRDEDRGQPTHRQAPQRWIREPPARAPRQLTGGTTAGGTSTGGTTSGGTTTGRTTTGGTTAAGICADSRGAGSGLAELPCSRQLADLEGKREREGCCGRGSNGGGRLRQLVDRFSFEYGWWRLDRSAACGIRLGVAVTGTKYIAHYQIGDVAGSEQTQSNPEEPAPHALLAGRGARFRVPSGLEEFCSGGCGVGRSPAKGICGGSGAKIASASPTSANSPAGAAKPSRSCSCGSAIDGFSGCRPFRTLPPEGRPGRATARFHSPLGFKPFIVVPRQQGTRAGVCPVCFVARAIPARSIAPNRRNNAALDHYRRIAPTPLGRLCGNLVELQEPVAGSGAIARCRKDSSRRQGAGRGSGILAGQELGCSAMPPRQR